ncbi:MAG: hypothetical protein IBJ11_04805 [Phycisphaerales bacterium]|nr:hypothetical protein [Phycisphaerales bacterium]
MSPKSVVLVAALAGLCGSGSANASVVRQIVTNSITGSDGNDIILGDYLAGPQVGPVSQGPDGTTLPWSAGASSLAPPTAGTFTNPLFQIGNPTENPFFNAASLRLSFGGLSSVFTWPTGQPVDLDFTVTFLLSDAANPSATPLAVLAAKGKGDKKPPPPPPPPPTPTGGSGDDILLGDYVISFNPNQPFTNPNGSPIAAQYAFRTGSQSSWSGISVIPSPSAAAMLAIGGLLSWRRRR